MKKILLTAGMLCLSLMAQAQCEAVATLNEDFSTFNAFPGNCWTASADSAPMVYIADGAATYYSSTSANVAGYVVSPELSTIDGNHILSFDAVKSAMSAPGDLTLQVGTLSIANDFTTFVAVGDAYTLTTTATNAANIVIPASTTQKYIAFKFTGTANHVAGTLDNVVYAAAPPVATCVAQALLDENFEGFTTNDLSENCWSGSTTTGPLVYLDTDGTNSYATFYSSSSANTAAYLVSPELTTIDGAHKLSFDAFKNAMSAPGDITIQVGTLAVANDYTTFVAYGTPYTMEAASVTYNNIVLPASATQKYIAFQLTGTGTHVAGAIDNVKWQAVTAGVNDVTATAFSMYPNPTANKNVTIEYSNLENGTVTVYSVTGTKVFTSALTSNSQSINLSSLTAGMYIVNVEAGNYSASKKLIVQ